VSKPAIAVVVNLPGEHRRTIALRCAVANDQGYITRTWVASMLGDLRDHASRKIREANTMVDRLLDDPATRLLVACEPRDPDRIIGWIAYAIVPGARTLHYVNVRAIDRKQGIGGLLIARAGLGKKQSAPLLYTCRGPAEAWAKAKRPDAQKVDAWEYLEQGEVS